MGSASLNLGVSGILLLPYILGKLGSVVLCCLLGRLMWWSCEGVECDGEVVCEHSGDPALGRSCACCLSSEARSRVLCAQRFISAEPFPTGFVCVGVNPQRSPQSPPKRAHTKLQPFPPHLPLVNETIAQTRSTWLWAFFN